MKAAVIATGVVLLLVVSVLRAFDWNPASFLHVGEDLPYMVDYVEGRLPNVPVFPDLGHDGKYFFVQAHDPLLLDPADHAAVIDRPAYRYQRMLFPILVSPALAFGEGALVWWFLAANLVAVGLGSWATGVLATRFNASGWWGLAFGLNPGVIFEVFVDGAGALALALAVFGILAVADRRRPLVVVFFVAAALTREVMVVVPLGIALWEWRRERSIDWIVVLGPLGAIGLWALYVRLRLQVPLFDGQTQELGLPFYGFGAALSKWVADPGVDLVAGLGLLAVAVLIIRRFWTSTSLIAWGIGGFALLAFFLTERVWLNYFDITRALAPLITGFVLVIGLERHDGVPARSDT